MSPKFKIVLGLAVLAVIGAITLHSIRWTEPTLPRAKSTPNNHPAITIVRPATALAPAPANAAQPAVETTPSSNPMPATIPTDPMTFIKSVAREGFPDLTDPNLMTKMTEAEIFKSTAGYGRNLAIALVKYSAEHDGRLPDENQLGAALAAYGPQDQGPPFEMLYADTLSTLKNPAQVVLLRQQEPVQAIDGKWVRTYVFADGHAEIGNSADGSFTAWENEHARSPAMGAASP